MTPRYSHPAAVTSGSDAPMNRCISGSRSASVAAHTHTQYPVSSASPTRKPRNMRLVSPAPRFCAVNVVMADAMLCSGVNA